MTHYDIQVYGKVQGVFYRANSLRKAMDLGIQGWVRNEANGSVRIAAEGSKSGLEEFLNWCKEGPAYAQVERVVHSESPVQNFSGFRIIR